MPARPFHRLSEFPRIHVADGRFAFILRAISTGELFRAESDSSAVAGTAHPQGSSLQLGYVVLAITA